jgi:hypothetical protein
MTLSSDYLFPLQSLCEALLVTTWLKISGN